MKYTVDGTRYTTIREGAQVEVEADDERQAAEKAQELAYTGKLKWERMVMDEQTQLATPIARALDDLHDALMEVQKQGYDVQILIDAIGDLPIPAVRLSRDGESVWCGTEHLVGSGL